MIQHVVYDEQDIDKFLEIDEIYETIEDSQILTKLLTVQNKISIIANIAPEDLKVIAYDLKFVQYNFKDHVIDEGDLSQEIFYIISGECQVFHKGKKLGSIPSGATFGEAAAIFHTKRNATVVCASKTATVLSFCIDHENMEFCAEALAGIYKNLAAQINKKLEDINENLVKK